MYNAVVFVFILQSSVKGLQIPQNSTTWFVAGVTLWLRLRTFPSVQPHVVCLFSTGTSGTEK